VSAPGTPRYPSELELDIRTPDGQVAHLRPIRPDDKDRLVDFHRHLSYGSVYRRFLGPHPELRPAEAERFTSVDYVERLAIIAEVADQLVAVARYDRLPETNVAEVAFVVGDAFQHQGIGTVLLRQLAQAARGQGITTFIAQTLVDNRDMLHVFINSGFPLETAASGNVVDVRLAVDHPPRIDSGHNLGVGGGDASSPPPS
jgi:RimJ/RimL family protein N-acetyltransferase